MRASHPKNFRKKFFLEPLSELSDAAKDIEQQRQREEKEEKEEEERFSPVSEETFSCVCSCPSDNDDDVIEETPDYYYHLYDLYEETSDYPYELYEDEFANLHVEALQQACRLDPKARKVERRAWMEPPRHHPTSLVCNDDERRGAFELLNNVTGLPVDLQNLIISHMSLPAKLSMLEHACEIWKDAELEVDHADTRLTMRSKRHPSCKFKVECYECYNDREDFPDDGPISAEGFELCVGDELRMEVCMIQGVLCLDVTKDMHDTAYDAVDTEVAAYYKRRVSTFLMLLNAVESMIKRMRASFPRVDAFILEQFVQRCALFARVGPLRVPVPKWDGVYTTVSTPFGICLGFTGNRYYNTDSSPSLLLQLAHAARLWASSRNNV